MTTPECRICVNLRNSFCSSCRPRPLWRNREVISARALVLMRTQRFTGRRSDRSPNPCHPCNPWFLRSSLRAYWCPFVVSPPKIFLEPRRRDQYKRVMCCQ
jgi:hypothetical protein